MMEKDRKNIASLLPTVTEFEKPFWDALQRSQFTIQRCGDCGHVQFPPSPVCTECLSDNVEWTPCGGRATLWSKVFFHKQYLKPYDDTPYAVITAMLEEGPLITGRMELALARAADFDAPLTVGFVATDDGTVLVEFHPLGE